MSTPEKPASSLAGTGGYFYKEHPRTCDPLDFWGQVKRTVNGKPISQAQIDLIVAATIRNLEIDASDVLLDLCCGNGALTTYFFALCHGGLGVDYSEYLIEIAKKYFVKRPEERFLLEDVVSFAKDAPEPEQFTKALCYGSFQYLPQQAAFELLSHLRRRFSGLRRLVIGNLPNKDRMQKYYRDGGCSPGMESSPDTPIGIWRSSAEFAQLAEGAGWHCTIECMPKEFYAAHYRYDAILLPA